MSSMFSQPMTSLPSFGLELAVAGADVDHLRAVEADGFRDNTAPAFLECTFDDFYVGSRRAGSYHERIFKIQSIDGGCECAHKFLGKGAL